MEWEENLQKGLFLWFRSTYPQYQGAWHHSPNGGLRHKVVAAKLKAMGAQKGFPDICIFLPTEQHSFLAIELKVSGQESRKVRRGKPTTEQLRWLVRLQECGAFAELAFGFDEAKTLIKQYMDQALKIQGIAHESR